MQSGANWFTYFQNFILSFYQQIVSDFIDTGGKGRKKKSVEAKIGDINARVSYAVLHTTCYLKKKRFQKSNVHLTILHGIEWIFFLKQVFFFLIRFLLFIFYYSGNLEVNGCFDSKFLPTLYLPPQTILVPISWTK